MPYWPGAYRAAISLTFDDGLRSQLEVAVPILDRAGLRATFYLNPFGAEESAGLGDSWAERLAPWAPAQAHGHEMGNHTILHPCSPNIDADWLKVRNLRDWTLERLQADVHEAQRRLSLAFPSQKETSFAYPCYEDAVGHGKKRVCYTPFIAENFIAARHKSEVRGELANDPRACDRHHLSSWPVEYRDAAAMIGLVEQSAWLGRWGIFTFHGIHEGGLSVADVDFSALVSYLVRREDIWVAPVAEIGAYISIKNG